MNTLLQLTSETSHFPFTAVTVLIVGFIAAVLIGSFAWYNSTRLVGWKEGKTVENQHESANKEKSANYDRKIVSAETAARMEREQDNYKQKPEPESTLDTTSGYTVSREGLLNNYPVEPEMYVNERGDLEEKQQLDDEQGKKELAEINRDQ
jgi:hypothetical protein